MGGPIVKDRLWFFAAGRKENSNTQVEPSRRRGLPFNQLHDQKRGEVKLAGAINPNHTVPAPTPRFTPVRLPPDRSAFSIEPEHTAYTGQQPESSAHVQLQRRAAQQPLRRGAVLAEDTSRSSTTAGPAPNIIDSPYLAQSGLAHYNAPYFDATDPEDRNNRQISGAVSYFLSTGTAGQARPQGRLRELPLHAHGRQLAVVDELRLLHGLRRPTPRGKPVFDANGYVVPVFTPGVSQLQNWHRRARRADRPHHAVVLRERPVDAQQPLGLQPRRSRRAGRVDRPPAASSPIDADPHRSPSRGVLRRQGRRQVQARRDLLPLRGQVHRDPVREQHERRATRTRSTTSTRVRLARAATSPPASTPPTTPRSSAASSRPPTSSTTRTSRRRSPRSGRRRRASSSARVAT